MSISQRNVTWPSHDPHVLKLLYIYIQVLDRKKDMHVHYVHSISTFQAFALVASWRCSWHLWQSCYRHKVVDSISLCGPVAGLASCLPIMAFWGFLQLRPCIICAIGLALKVYTHTHWYTYIYRYICTFVVYKCTRIEIETGSVTFLQHIDRIFHSFKVEIQFPFGSL